MRELTEDEKQGVMNHFENVMVKPMYERIIYDFMENASVEELRKVAEFISVLND